MGLKTALLRIFTWWNDATFSTLWYTRRKGVLVGRDEQGNSYYRTRDDSHRWVIYAGVAEASRIPPGWHAWIHRRTDTPPTEDGYKPHAWEKPWRPNPTGTPEAEFPPGSLHLARPAALARKSWHSWQPSQATGSKNDNAAA